MYCSAKSFAEFEIIFNDPPFLYEKDSKTGIRYKTNKKIKIIENVKFEHLKKIESSKNSLFINQAVKHAGIKDKYNLREFTKDNLINFRNDGKLSGGLDDQNDTFAFKL